jgi:formylglycine-generating enzyme required for sulfatase activity
MRLAAVAIAALATACLDARNLPPLGEVLVIVDTDAAVPLLVSRLRVDAYTTEGAWYASQDFALPMASAWPTSFGVFSPNAGQSKTAMLRLRAYADGNVRDYRGEVFMPRPAPTNPGVDTPLPPAPKGNAPRLIENGVDVTPTTEPQPLLAIDRLLLVETPGSSVESLRLTLRGACFGTMADLSGKTTCTETENQREALGKVSLDPVLALPTSSLEGGFGVAPCDATPRPGGTAKDGTPLFDEEVCVPGGAYVFGTATLPAASVGTAVPERIAVIPPFRMDRYEVTVGRYRQAVLNGFTAPASDPPLPITNDAPFPADPDPIEVVTAAFCTYSSKPVGRETFPVSCIDWDLARAFCQFEGGDLPTESQWEYAAQMAGRASKDAFPWGGPDDADPVCAQAIFGRGYDASNDPTAIGECTPMGFGPLAEDATVYSSGHVPAGVVGLGDVSVGLGIANLGASVSEAMRDTAYSLGSNCWMSQPLTSPHCDDPAGPNRSLRGAGWDETQNYTFAGFRYYAPRAEVSPTTGFRCVRSGTP